MAIAKKTALHQTTIYPDGRARIVLAMTVEEDGVPITDPKLHSIMVEPGADIDALLKMNSDNIVARDDLRFPAIPDEVAATVKRHVASAAGKGR